MHLHPLLFVAVSIGIAALIGGLTNHLAIRMLFHPRRPLLVAGRRLPFTSGLIPKRKVEIARSLGKVVADYLVTSHGISALLGQESFLQSVEEKLKASLRRLARSEATVEQLCLRLWSAEQWAGIKRSLVGELGILTEKTADWLWLEKGWADVKIADLLPDGSGPSREALIEQAVQWIIEAARRELASPNGEAMLRAITARLLDQAGGFLGTLAGIFMDEDKVIGKTRQVLWEALGSAAIRGALHRFADDQLRKVGELRLHEVAAFLAGDEFTAGPGKWAASRVDWEPQLELLLKTRAEDLLGGRLLWFEERLAKAVRLSVQVVEQRIERVFEAIELPALVEKQVNNFPIERLEKIILDISGREFRAITWLGALIGGMIGFAQALLLLWIG